MNTVTQHVVPNARSHGFHLTTHDGARVGWSSSEAVAHAMAEVHSARGVEVTVTSPVMAASTPCACPRTA